MVQVRPRPPASRLAQLLFRWGEPRLIINGLSLVQNIAPGEFAMRIMIHISIVLNTESRAEPLGVILTQQRFNFRFPPDVKRSFPRMRGFSGSGLSASSAE